MRIGGARPRAEMRVPSQRGRKRSRGKIGNRRSRLSVALLPCQTAHGAVDLLTGSVTARQTERVACAKKFRVKVFGSFTLSALGCCVQSSEAIQRYEPALKADKDNRSSAGWRRGKQERKICSPDPSSSFSRSPPLIIHQNFFIEMQPSQ